MKFFKQIVQPHDIIHDIATSVVKQLASKVGVDDATFLKVDERGKNDVHQIHFDEDKAYDSTIISYNVSSALTDRSQESNSGLGLSNSSKTLIRGAQWKVEEITTYKQVTLSINIMSKSESVIRRIIDTLNMLALNSGGQVLHKVLIQYPLPTAVGNFIYLATKLGDEIDKEKSTASMITTNVVGTNATRSVKYNLSGVGGLFGDLYGVTSDEMDIEDNKYRTRFTYKVEVPVPSNTVVEFNSILNGTYLGSIPVIKQAFGLDKPLTADLMHIRNTTWGRLNMRNYIDNRLVIPALDHPHRYPVGGMREIASFLCTLNDDLVLDLNRLGEHSFDKKALELIIKAQSRLFVRDECFLHMVVTIQEDIETKQVRIPSKIDGTEIYLEEDYIKPNAMYRVHMYFRHNDAFLTTLAKTELEEYTKYGVETLLAAGRLKEYSIDTIYTLPSTYAGDFVVYLDIEAGDTDFSALAGITSIIEDLILDTLETLKIHFPDLYTAMLESVDDDESKLVQAYLDYDNLNVSDITKVERTRTGLYKIYYDKNIVYYDEINNYIDVVLYSLPTNLVVVSYSNPLILGNRGKPYICKDDTLYDGDTLIISPIATEASKNDVFRVSSKALLRTVQHSRVIVQLLRKG